MDQGAALGFKFQPDEGGIMGLLHARIQECSSWLSRANKMLASLGSEPNDEQLVGPMHEEHGASAGPKGTQSVTQAVMLDAENQNGDQMLQPSDVCAVTGGGNASGICAVVGTAPPKCNQPNATAVAESVPSSIVDIGSNSVASSAEDAQRSSAANLQEHKKVDRDQNEDAGPAPHQLAKENRTTFTATAIQSLLTEASSLAVDMGEQELRLSAAWWDSKTRLLLEDVPTTDSNIVAKSSKRLPQKSRQLKHLLTELNRGQFSIYVDKQLLAAAKTKNKDQQSWLRR
jgi:hypothetical protein